MREISNQSNVELGSVSNAHELQIRNAMRYVCLCLWEKVEEGLGVGKGTFLRNCNKTEHLNKICVC